MNDAAILATARGIRRRVLEHTITHNGGYLSQACSTAELFALLYGRLMRLGTIETALTPLPYAGTPSQANPHAFTGDRFNGPKAPELDRFYLSPVHYALVLYAALVEVGRMSENGMRAFNVDGSTVEMIGAEHSPGLELTSGSLGQTLSQVGGIAWARKRRGETGHHWVMMSDGEFQSGQTWETIMALSFHQLGNITVLVDVNGQQCDGRTADVMAIEPLAEKLRAFGAAAVRSSGHDLAVITEAVATPHPHTPLFVLADTDPCRGISLLESRRPKLHYVRFKTADERSEYRSYLDEMSANT